MNRPALLAALVAATSLAAQAPRVRDSAGVRIIENSPRLTAPFNRMDGDGAIHYTAYPINPRK